MKKAALSLLLAAALPASAAAQTAPQPAAPPPARPAQPPAAQPRPGQAPGTAAQPAPPVPGATPGATAGVSEPQLPKVEDAMLAEPAPPQHELKSWREALSLIRTQSPNLRQSLARIQEAVAQVQQTKSAYMPRLNAFGNIGYEIIRNRRTNQEGERVLLPDPPVGGEANLTLDVPLFVPKAWYDKKTAEQNVDSLKLDVKEVERQIVAGLAEAIVAVVNAERLAEVSRVSLESALSTLDLNKRRAALGASSTLDVLRIEDEVQLARAQVVTANETLRRSREALGMALGSSESWGVAQGVSLDTLGDDARATCRPERDVGTRTDVLAARSKVGLAERQIGSVDRSFWPTIGAQSVFAYSPSDTRWGNASHFSWRIGAILNWNIYDGGLRYGQKDEAEATTQVVKEQFKDTRIRAEQEVVQAFRAVEVAEANLQVSTRAREIASERARLSRIAFLNGSGTSFDLVDSATRLRNAELDLAIKEFQVLRARVAAILSLSTCKV